MKGNGRGERLLNPAGADFRECRDDNAQMGSEVLLLWTQSTKQKTKRVDVPCPRAAEIQPGRI